MNDDSEALIEYTTNSHPTNLQKNIINGLSINPWYWYTVCDIKITGLVSESSIFCDRTLNELLRLMLIKSCLLQSTEFYWTPRLPDPTGSIARMEQKTRWIITGSKIQEQVTLAPWIMNHHYILTEIRNRRTGVSRAGAGSIFTLNHAILCLLPTTSQWVIGYIRRVSVTLSVCGKFSESNRLQISLSLPRFKNQPVGY